MYASRASKFENIGNLNWHFSSKIIKDTKINLIKISG